MKYENSHKKREGQVRSLLQKVHGNPKPVRDYRRFPKSKVADTGEDTNSKIIEFIKKDIIKPLERPKPKIEPIKFENEKWPIGTEKKCNSIEKLPKIQQYKDYYFPPKLSTEIIEKQKCNFLNTDHIALKVPNIKNIDESRSNKSFLNLKSKFGSHTETYKDGWIPSDNIKTMNNRSSVTYDIISNDNKTLSGLVVLKVMDKKLANKKKGIAEFSDLAQPYYSNINKKFVDYYEQNPKIFHNHKGIFTHMYDAAHRNGNMVVPFRNNNDFQNSNDSPKKMLISLNK